MNFQELLQSALVFLQNHHAVEILIVLGGLLVLVDYYFPTDWPAHVGYACIAAAFFFIVNLPPFGSLLVSVGVWLMLSALHRLWFRRFLETAPGEARQNSPESSLENGEPKR